MRRNIAILSFIVSMVVFASCGGNAIRHELDDIESYIQARPDSAMAAIRAIDTNALSSPSLKAQYSLLHAMALDKNYIDTTNLSVIMPAIEYYEKSGDAVHRMRAWYYHGRILQNAGNSQDAMYSFSKALDISEKTSDNHYKMLINSILSDLYSVKYIADLALLHAEHARKYAIKSHDKKSEWILDGRIAVCLGNSREKEKADSAYRAYMCKPILDTVIFARNLFNYSQLLVRRYPTEPDKAISYFLSAKNEFRGKPKTDDYYAYAYALTLKGETEKADKIINQLKNRAKTVKSHYWLYRISRERNQITGALYYFEKSIRNQDSIIISNLRQSLVRSQGEYYIEKSLKESERRRADQTLYILMFLIITVVLSIIVFVVRRRWRKKLEIINFLKEETDQQLTVMTENISEIENKLKEYRKKYLLTYKRQYQLLNNLCASYLQPSSKEPKDRIFEQVQLSLKSLTKDEECPSTAEKLVNKTLDNIMKVIRNDYPEFSEGDYKFISLLIMGFEAKTIALMMNYTTKTVYEKKDRIKKRISRSESTHKENILALIG